MRSLSARLCIVGGLFWGLKPLYDWLLLDRRVNTGYLASDLTDYIKFLFPLLCLGGIFVLSSLYQKKVCLSTIILSISLLFNGLFHFFEVYITESSIPFGLLFMFTGTLFLFIGSISLVVQLKHIKSIPRPLFWLAQALFVITLLFCLFPFVSRSLPISLLTPIMVGLMMLVGLIWASIGGVLLKKIKKDSSITKTFGVY